MARTCEEKYRGRCSNENMDDGSLWTLKYRKTIILRWSDVIRKQHEGETSKDRERGD